MALILFDPQMTFDVEKTKKDKKKKKKKNDPDPDPDPAFYWHPSFTKEFERMFISFSEIIVTRRDMDWL